MQALALMNSAPAELLHPLTYAALQPSLTSPSRTRTSAAVKKNAGNRAGIGNSQCNGNPVFQRKRRHTRHGQVQRREPMKSNRSSTVH
jgi:hypothetical protein